VTQRRFIVAIILSALMVLIAAVVLLGDFDGPGRLGVRAGHEGNGPQVRWTIDSEPSGAQVIRDDNGQVLGETPYHADRPRGSGEIKLRIRAPGYGEQTVIADSGNNLSTTVYLNKLAPPPNRREELDRLAAAAPVVPTGTVEWKIASRPSGAAVLRADNGENLGMTPFSRVQPAAPGTLKVILRAPGYADTLVILDQSSPMDIKYVLRSVKPQRPKRPAQQDEIPLFDSEEGSGSSPSPGSTDSSK
jgi:hypothetical protein